LKWDESMFDLGFNTDHLPMAVAGQPYDGAIYVSGKNGEFGKSVRVTDGALPKGIGLEMDDAGLWARFTGTPAVTGTSTFTVEISNGLEPAVSKQFVIHVGYAPRILTQTLPNAALNSGYACAIEADAYPDATWSFVSGTLPEGLTLQDGGAGSGNAYLLGTPTKAGEFTFTLACDNFANGIEQVEYTIRVEKAQASGADGATQEELKSLENQVASLQAQRKADASKVAKLEKKIKKLQAKLPKEVVINAKKVTAKKVKAALKKANNAGASYVVLGSAVKKISKKAFAGTLVTKLVVKTAKLKKSAVKGCLKGSKVKTVQVKVAKKKLKSVKKSYRKLFVKKVAGKTAKVKFSAA